MQHIFNSKFLIPAKHQNPAEWTYERLGNFFKDFEEGLDSEHEIGIMFVSFGNNIVYHVKDIGYWGPDIIIFHCLTDDEKPLDLIQNVSQLNVLLTSAQKLGEQPRRIGFSLPKEHA